MDLFELSNWIFDLDGTLTLSTHDFEALRAELGLPSGKGLLEALGDVPRGIAETLRERLESWEREHALRAEAQPGVVELLSELARRGARRGVLTRNTHATAWLTLRSCGLDRFFAPEDVLGREAAPAKPAPDGVLALLARWNAEPARTLMAGDFLFDLQAGQAAGVHTLYFDPRGLFPHRAWANRTIRAWRELWPS